MSRDLKERVSHVDIRRKRILGRGCSQHKGTKVGAYPVCSKGRKEARVGEQALGF